MPKLLENMELTRQRCGVAIKANRCLGTRPPLNQKVSLQKPRNKYLFRIQRDLQSMGFQSSGKRKRRQRKILGQILGQVQAVAQALLYSLKWIHGSSGVYLTKLFLEKSGEG